MMKGFPEAFASRAEGAERDGIAAQVDVTLSPLVLAGSARRESALRPIRSQSRRDRHRCELGVGMA